MSVFSGIVRYEFLMQIRRRALWIAFAVTYLILVLPDLLNHPVDRVDGTTSAHFAVLNFVLPFQIFVPIVAGFFLSDRLYRDKPLATSEWLIVSGADERRYVWGKYLGVVAATVLVAFVCWAISLLIEVAVGAILPVTIPYVLLAFGVVVLPSYLFIAAFSLAVPILMSLRLYQILFSCYWLWAHQQRVPSVSGTPLAPGGDFAIQILVQAMNDADQSYARSVLNGPFGWQFQINLPMALLNIGLLLALALLALFSLERYLRWKQERA